MQAVRKFLKRLKLGNFNKLEKIYVIAFLVSIFAGSINGIVSSGYFQPFEQAGRLDLKEGEDNLTIFYKNFLVSGIDLVTAGFASFYFNFVSFSVAVSFSYVKGTLLALPLILLTFGILELVGSMFIGLVGLNFAERVVAKFFKIKSKLNVQRLFLLGFIFLLVASAIEYGLISFLKAT